MYYATLGHTPALSLLELSALGFAPFSVSTNLVRVDDPGLPKLADHLGGTTRVMQAVMKTTKDKLLPDLDALIADSPSKNFAISNYSSLPLTPEVLSTFKTSLTRERGTRFLSFNSSGHSLIALRKQHITEYSIIEDQGELVIAQTLWIQDADDWSKRDRSRPYQDIKRGMLPPKLARILVNLATQGKKGTLLDPFCGTGTILSEAILVGCNVLGSDISREAVEGTKVNLSWLCDQYSIQNTPYNILSHDATHISEHLPSVDFIATEPYLGPLIDQRHLPDLTKLKNIARGLDKLYRGSLRDWHKFLPEKGRVVMVLPEFHLSDHPISTLQIDTLPSLGYNGLDSVAYAKPGAVVIRNITILEKI